MTSLSQQINNVAVRMAQECNAIRSEIGNHADLLTIEKSTIVGAINELYNSGGGGGGGAPIDDTGVFLNKVWSSSHTSQTIDGRISVALASLPVAATIDDVNTTPSTVWSSFKTNQQINTMLAAGLSGFLDDNAMSTDTTWSSSKISQVISSIPPSATIDDAATSTSTTWSSDKITTQIAAAVTGLSKASVGLGNVDNTSDAAKPVSTAQAAAINASVSGLTKASVGLANVDNTSDANKPVSTAQNAAIGAAVAGVTKASLGLGNVDNTSDINKPVSTATNAAITTAVGGITKASLGLGNVDNTSDANKPVSTAQAAADAAALSAAKAYADGLVVGLWDDRGAYDASTNVFPSSGGSGSAGAVLKGDIWTISTGGTLGGTPVVQNQTVRAMIDAPGQVAGNWTVGLAGSAMIDDSITDNVVGRAPSQNAVYDALQLKQDKLSVGTAAQVRLGNNALATADKALVGLGNIDNTSDANKPVSTAQTAAINAAVAGVTKGTIGLGNVDNTSDVNKPVSTAQAAAIATAVGAVVKTAVKDEGTALTADVSEINFVGPGVSATNVGSVVTVTIPGSTGGAAIDDATTAADKVWSSSKTNTAINAGVASVTKTSLGLGNVENKDAATIRAGLTAGEVATALTFTPGPALTVKDEGANLTTTATSINFVGPGVTSTNTAGAVTVTVPGGASSSDAVPEGSSNLYYTDARAILAVLAGYTVAGVNAVVAATDSIRTAFGKLQKQISDFVAQKGASGGLASMINYRIALPNDANTFTSTLSNANTASFNYVMPNKAGTVALLSDTASPSAANTFTALQSFDGSTGGTPSFGMRVKTALESGLVVTGSMTGSAFALYIGSNGQLQFFNNAQTVDWGINLTFSNIVALNTVMNIGDAVTFTLIATHGATPYKMTGVQVDGAAQTVLWQGGAGNATGTANSRDAYSFTVFKTANQTFTVFGSQSIYK